VSHLLFGVLLAVLVGFWAFVLLGLVLVVDDGFEVLILFAAF
jgi:hypothetical protein